MLTPAEREAGRAYRAACQAVLDALNRRNPPGLFVLVHWRVIRHECEAGGGASTVITLTERYELSPAQLSGDGSKVVSPAGQFAWIWKEGRCSGCKLVARTARGWCTPAADREADRARRTIERQAGPRPGDPRLAGA